MIFLHFKNDGICTDAQYATGVGAASDEKIVDRIKEAIKTELNCGGHCASINGYTVNEVLNEMEEESVDLPEHVADSIHSVLLKLKKEVQS